MPIAEFAGDLSWGYNPRTPFAIEHTYGGPAGFKRFVKAAHARGIAVILDVVYNHFGPSDLHLWQFDGWSENGLGGIYFYNDHRAETPWGQTRPDYGRPEVRQYIRDNALMWLHDYHVDGLRMDMTLYMRTVGGPGDGGARRWMEPDASGSTRRLRATRPGFITIAEDLQDSEWLTKPAAEGGAGFGSQWDARFVHPVRELAATPLDEHRSMEKLATRSPSATTAMPFGASSTASRTTRSPTASGACRRRLIRSIRATAIAQKRSTLAAALALTAPGIPMLFQGQEFLQSGWFRDDRPLDWGQMNEHAGIVQAVRRSDRAAPQHVRNDPRADRTEPVGLSRQRGRQRRRVPALVPTTVRETTWW